MSYTDFFKRATRTEEQPGDSCCLPIDDLKVRALTSRKS